MRPVVSGRKRGYDRVMSGADLLACHECDLLQRATPLARGHVATCTRCSAPLYRNTPGSLEKTLAYALAAAVLFVLANIFPVAELEAQDSHTSATLFGTAWALHEAGMSTIAALVFATTILMPALELVALIWMLVPLQGRRTQAFLPAAFRLWQGVQRWGMMEVYLLGALISLAKLKEIAVIAPGVALWSLGGLMLLLAAADATFDPRAFWARVEASR